jgi:hypothetical protein
MTYRTVVTCQPQSLFAALFKSQVLYCAMLWTSLVDDRLQRRLVPAASVNLSGYNEGQLIDHKSLETVEEDLR